MLWLATLLSKLLVVAPLFLHSFAISTDSPATTLLAGDYVIPSSVAPSGLWRDQVVLYRHQVRDEIHVSRPIDPKGANTGVFVVPDGAVFTLGDNRGNALDSRFSKQVGGPGYLPTGNVLYRRSFVLFTTNPGASGHGHAQTGSALRLVK